MFPYIIVNTAVYRSIALVLFWLLQLLTLSAFAAAPLAPSAPSPLVSALDALWSARIVQGRDSGFGSLASVDRLDPQLTGDESGATSDSPSWCFQAGTGMAPALLLYADAAERLNDPVQWSRATALGRSLIGVQSWHAGGWPQDGAIIGNRWEPIGVWGSPGNRRHILPLMRDALTLDDGTSAACGMALLRLHEAAVRRAARRGEPTLISTQWLDGAKYFAQQLLELDGDAVPQVIPRDRGLLQTHNQNADLRSPDGPGYMAAATLNDNVASHAVAFLAECARVSGDDRYQERARRLVLWLVQRPTDAFPGWSQQYDWHTGLPRWGRHMEPPAICTGEHGVVSTLLWWRLHRASNAEQTAIDAALSRYLSWLARAERPLDSATNQPDARRVWRYYAPSPLHPSGPLLPAFAKDFALHVGADKLALAAGGQPYIGEWDAIWLTRLRPVTTPRAGPSPLRPFDFDRAGRFVADFPAGPLPRSAWPASRLPELLATRDAASGLWPFTATVAGRQRKLIDIGATVGRIRCLLNAVPHE
ncbi:MAG: hypothetical protein SF069_03125 [Phycisphaerae bacterium]|nr:hypothetical protein [Phycisphaerae bacterium]